MKRWWSHASAGVATLGGLALGYLPQPWKLDAETSPWMALPWVGALTVTVCAVIGHTYVQIQTDRRWTPTPAFLSRWGVLVEKIQVAVGALRLREHATSQEVEQTIRAILNAIAVLAAAFDDVAEEEGGNGATRSANLMLFVPTHERGAWESLVKFASDLDPGKFAGLLVLRPSLSASSASPSPVKLPQIALLVPEPTKVKRSRKWTALPGAPLAFATRSPEAMNDVSKMGKWTSRSCDCPPSVAEEVGGYFEQLRANGLKGFASFPVYSPTADYRDERTPIAVVNLDWRSESKIGKPQYLNIFYRLAFPLLVSLGEAIGRDLEALRREPDREDVVET